MYYYDPNDRTSRRWGAIATACYALLLLAAFCLVRFDFGIETLRPGEGVLIDFGTTDGGEGPQDLHATDAEAPAANAAPAAAETEAEVSTVEQSDAEVAETKPVAAPQQAEATVAAPHPAETETPPAEQPRTVNTRALFPGRTAGSHAVSEGNASGEGNAGDRSGSPAGSREGTGQSSSGISYDLSGRSVVGALPLPAYTANASGKVIIDVTVDASGRVTNAAYHPQGSTTNHAELVAAARNAALKARFSESESFVQGGTITYIFRMN